MLSLRALLTTVLALSLAACADDSGAPTPAIDATPAPAGKAAVIYVLTQKMVPGYQRTVDVPLNPLRLASENATPGLAGELANQGFLSGARVEFTVPKGNLQPLAFDSVSSDAIIFGDAAGASRYFASQSRRIRSAAPGATVSPLSGLPRANVDDLAAFRSALPPPTGAEVELAFIALLRNGRVVTQVFARGTSASRTTVSGFLPLVSGQESLLAVPPGI